MKNTQPMKIALIGAQGVGKTSLAKALHESIPNSHVVRESVRECPYPCDANADFKTEWWILSHSILAEQEAREAKHQLIITDRCLLDIAVYTKLIHGADPKRITQVQRDMIERSIEQWFQEDPYQHMFFLKVKPDVWKTRDLDDGFRSLDAGWYQALDREFDDAVERFGIGKKCRLHVIHNDGGFHDLFHKVKSVLGH